MKDDSQLKAIYHPVESSAFVTAPPGYGKTYVMTKRIEYLISEGAVKLPHKLLALTFSNAAADQMKKRIKTNIPQCENYVDVMTFHTFAYKLLRCYGNHVGLKRKFSILNERTKYQYKSDYYNSEISGESSDYWGRRVSSFISGYNEWYNTKYLQGNSVYEVPGQDIYDKLNNSMKEDLINEYTIDFDNLLFKSIELLETNEIIKNLIFNKYSFLLADEFQDTNHAQYTLFKQIATNTFSEKKRVYVLGDKRQSIMRFQGANPDNIDFLIEDFGCEPLELEINHRTDSENISTLTSKLRDSSFVVSKPQHILYINESVEDEMNRIVDYISYLSKNEVKLHDICVLFPHKATSSVLKQYLEQGDIDYIDITDFKVDSICKNYSELIKEIEQYINDKKFTGSVSSIVNELIHKYYSSEQNNIVLKTFRDFSRIFDGGNYSSFKTWERLQEFYNYFQMEIDWSTIIKSHVKNKLYLSTIHSSKGLEFDYVFMFGITHHRMPFFTKCFPCQDFRSPKRVDVTESKDLFYVGVSRAIKDVIFFFSQQDEQNLTKTTRKISCVFKDAIDCLKFIDYSNNEYSFEDGFVQDLFCQPRCQ
ncbi:UvrD-helicase domain-containing protein [Methanolobus psychrotolerans]|uniref:UvrD-helicase domain-containing protein n=1 Tax=Methanolobus psychrotolerans TaxID=1874706 RepID=UPI000B91BD13|nr:ATP-dependent helicase [Methanolobus psychrotolerans]